MMTNVKLFQTKKVSKRFQMRFLVCCWWFFNSSCIKLSWTSQHGQWSIMLRYPCPVKGPMNHKRKISSFPCLGVLGLVVEAWNLIGHVWNLVEWVQILVVANDRLAYMYFGVQHDCPRRGVKVWWEDVQCTELPWTYLNIFEPILEQCMCMWTVTKPFLSL